MGEGGRGCIINKSDYLLIMVKYETQSSNREENYVIILFLVEIYQDIRYTKRVKNVNVRKFFGNGAFGNLGEHENG